MKAKLKTLKRGQTFYGAGIQWLVLGQTNSSQGLPSYTHIVSTGIVERRAFDEKDRNNLGVSTLLAYLNGEFLERIEDAFGEGTVVEQVIDLTSNDGLKDYGYVKTKVGLLTEEEYRQHRDILLPLRNNGWWWLATPYSTERAGSPSLVREVYSGGTLAYSHAYSGHIGVRPALYLKSDISVSLDGNDESTIEVSEEELYKAAVEKYGEISQIDQATEEMAELIVALNKYKRYINFHQGNKEKILSNVAEERADVQIMLEQLNVIFGKNENAKEDKLKHLSAIVGNENALLNNQRAYITTNADHIRSMSDGELENFIPNWSYTCACKAGDRYYIDCDNQCEKCVSEWLKQPYTGK